LEDNLPIQIEIEFILAKIEFKLGNRSKAMDSLLFIYELVKKDKLNIRKRECPSGCLTDDLLLRINLTKSGQE